MLYALCSFIASHPIISGFLLYYISGNYIKNRNKKEANTAC